MSKHRIYLRIKSFKKMIISKFKLTILKSILIERTQYSFYQDCFITTHAQAFKSMNYSLRNKLDCDIVN